jgi:hypothetical protein
MLGFRESYRISVPLGEQRDIWVLKSRDDHVLCVIICHSCPENILQIRHRFVSAITRLHPLDVRRVRPLVYTGGGRRSHMEGSRTLIPVGSKVTINAIDDISKRGHFQT